MINFFIIYFFIFIMDIYCGGDRFLGKWVLDIKEYLNIKM